MDNKPINLGDSLPQAGTKVYKLADTNLPGVSAIRWSKEAAGAPLSHAEVIANELLGSLDHTDVRYAALRQRLLRREWPDDARIVPHLVPQIGVTHESIAINRSFIQNALLL